MDDKAVHNLARRLLDPRNTAKQIFHCYNLHWLSFTAFRKTLCNATSYDDYIDLLDGLSYWNKRSLLNDLQAVRCGHVLPRRWKHVIETNGPDLLALYKSMNLKRCGKCNGLSTKSGGHTQDKLPVGFPLEPRVRRSKRLSQHRKDSLVATEHSSPVGPISQRSHECLDHCIRLLDAVILPITPPPSERKPRRTTGKVSTHFPSPSKRPPAGTSVIVAPPLSAPSFGIVQEALSTDPYRLLIAVMFLNKTAGRSAMPIFRTLMSLYPTPLALSEADPAALTELIYPLGLQVQRAKKLIAFATAWLTTPPRAGTRYRTRDYPLKGDGRALAPAAVEPDAELVNGALEIGHLPGCGPYAFDSWRIFCRDVLRGVAESYNGEGAREGFEPEWKRVVPLDKELRACLRWMWLREGWEWDPLTGERRRVGETEGENLNDGVNVGESGSDEESLTMSRI